MSKFSVIGRLLSVQYCSQSETALIRQRCRCWGPRTEHGLHRPSGFRALDQGCSRSIWGTRGRTKRRKVSPHWYPILPLPIWRSGSIELLSAQLAARNRERPGVITLGFLRAGPALSLHPSNPSKIVQTSFDSLKNAARAPKTRPEKKVCWNLLLGVQYEVITLKFEICAHS